MNLDQGNQVIDLLGIARRRGKLIAIIAGAAILVTYWIAMALPNLYTSSAMVLVEPQSVDEELVNSGVPQSDLNERLGLMTAEILSRTRLSNIITKFGLYEEESEDMERSEIIELMRSYINVEPVLSELEQDTRRRDVQFNTFRIIFRHENKHIAALVAQEIANSFIDANIEARTDITKKSLDFMSDEITSLTEQLAVIESQIATVKAENAGRLPEDFDATQRRLQFAMNDLRDAQRALSTAESDASYWENQALTASSLTAPGDQNSPAYRLQALEMSRSALLARGYTQRHPDVVQVEAEIALLREQLAAAGSGAGADEPPRTVGEQHARSEQRRAALRIEAAKTDIEQLRETIRDLEARLADTPAVAERLDALNRQYEHLYKTYQDFSSRLQQASVQSDLERRQLGERFRILESAEPAVEPSSPNRLLLLALGAILGLALGAGVGLIAEVSDSSVHTASELQAAMGLPVLVSVPRIMLESDRAARSRRIMREAIAAAAIVVFVLIGGVATYILVNRAGGQQAEAEAEAVNSTGSAASLIDLRPGRG